VLQEHDRLSSLSKTTQLNVQDVIGSHDTSLTTEFTELFAQKKFDQLKVLIDVGTRRDKEFFYLIDSKHLSSLLDVMVKSFKTELAALAEKHSQTNVNVKQHAQALVELKVFASGISDSTMSNLANEQIVKYVDRLSATTSIDNFDLGTHLSTLPLGFSIISTSPRLASEYTINAIAKAGITLDHALTELQRLNPGMDNTQIESLRAMGLAFDDFFKKILRAYCVGYENNFNVGNKVDLVRDVVAKVESVKGHLTSMDLVEILAGVFAYWSLLSSSNTVQKKLRVIEPHKVQLLAIFRLLELDNPTASLNSITKRAALGKLNIAGHVIQVNTCF
jgi:hypothetical protein